MNWDVENPAHALASVHGNQWLSVGRHNHYEDDENEKEFFRVNMEVDTRQLTAAEENLLYAALDDIACYRCGTDFYGDYLGELKVESVEVDGFDDNEVYGKITLKGYVPEETYDEIWNALDEFSGRIEVVENETSTH